MAQFGALDTPPKLRTYAPLRLTNRWRRNVERASEGHFQCKLNLPRVYGCGVEDSGIARGGAVREQGTVVNGRVEVGVVENIEDLGAKLEVQSVRDFRLLDQ